MTLSIFIYGLWDKLTGFSGTERQNGPSIVGQTYKKRLNGLVIVGKNPNVPVVVGKRGGMDRFWWNKQAEVTGFSGTESKCTSCCGVKEATWTSFREAKRTGPSGSV